jgi:hypothetical protein
MALLIALLVENGCKVYLRSEDDELRGDSVEMVTKDGEEIFHEVGVWYSAGNLGIEEDKIEGFHEMLFTGTAIHFLAKRGYGITHKQTKSHNYSFYTKLVKVYTPEKIFTPEDSRVTNIINYLNRKMALSSVIEPRDKFINKLLL